LINRPAIDIALMASAAADGAKKHGHRLLRELLPRLRWP
jgi:hypothetical protein